MRRTAANPRAWVDLPSRNGYMATHPLCEFCLFACRTCKIEMVTARDPHHLAGRGWRGADDPRNIVASCRRCHEIVDDEYRMGVVWSLYVKLKSGTLDLKFLSDGWRRDVAGTLENWYPHLQTKRLEDMATAVLDFAKQSKGT